MRKREQFIVKGPNRVWSIDGHDKLSRFGFHIYASIDAFSRYIVWCYIGHYNRTAVSVNKQYLTAIAATNTIPKLIHSDKGRETVLLCNSHLVLRRSQTPTLPLSKAYSYGTSTKNQRIESWWNLLANAQTDTWQNLFVEFEKEGYFDGGDIDVICLQYVYMTMIRTQVQTFVQVHNTHRIRRQRRREHYLHTGRPVELYYYPPTGVRNYGLPTDKTVLSELESQVKDYSLDEYLTDSTMDLCTKLLHNGGYQTSFSFSDNNCKAYIFLRQAISEYIKNTGKEIHVLSTPTGAEQWILDRETRESDQGIPLELNIDLTDNEEDIPFIEENIIDDDANEYLGEVSSLNTSGSSNQLNSSFFEDDGFVLDI
ncbi:hypothetical protein HOY80DRAFT_1094323 [Tuber brumale]|nr:hypothetical protein HOY80DRAFT_1094323 [Tuber brumale]